MKYCIGIDEEPPLQLNTLPDVSKSHLGRKEVLEDIDKTCGVTYSRTVLQGLGGIGYVDGPAASAGNMDY